ncbi:Probable non-specific lipid-transfer protein AKCS9 [Linum perenne]
MKLLPIILFAAALLLILASSETEAARVPPAAAVVDATCNPSELSPCLAALTSGSRPTGQCCGKLKQQQPCLCGYIRNPSFRQFVTSPGAKTVLRSCGVAYPSC